MRFLRRLRSFVAFYLAIGFGAFISAYGTDFSLRLWSILLWPVIVAARLS